MGVRSWLPALVLLLPLACDRADEGAEARDQALRAATDELAAARAAFEADRTAMQQELAALRKAVESVDGKLDALAAERRRPSPTRPPVDPSGLALPDADAPIPRSELEASIAAAVRCESEARCTIERSFLDTLLANQATLARQARIVPAARDGATVGFRLYALRRGSLPKALGFENGDLVRSINGHALTTVEQSLEAYAKLRHEKLFTVEVERRGVPVTLTIEVVGA